MIAKSKRLGDPLCISQDFGRSCGPELEVGAPDPRLTYLDCLEKQGVRQVNVGQ